MSARNKLKNKQSRRDARREIAPATGTRQIGRLTNEDSANILADPKSKLTGTLRRRLLARRGLAVEGIETEPKNFAVRIAVKLTRLTLAQLFRRQAQAARRASTCKHIIEKLSPGSMFAISVKSQQTANLSLLKQINAEIKSRNHEKNTQ